MSTPARSHWLALEATALLLHLTGHVLHDELLQLLAIALAMLVFFHHARHR